MAKNGQSGCPKEFLDALAAASHCVEDAPLNAAPLAADVKEGLRSLVGVTSYQRFLAKARKQKAQRKCSGADFEKEVLGQARRAQADTRAMFAAALRVTRQIKNAGLFEGSFAAWTSGVEAAGELDLNHVWTEAMSDSHVRKVAEDLGFGPELLAHANETLSSFQHVQTVRDGVLRSKTRIIGGQHAGTEMHEVAIAPRRRGKARRAIDLLTASRFDTAAMAFATPGSFESILGWREHSDEAIDPLDAILGAAVLGTRTMTWHVRRLEDVGLATYEGSDPASLTTLGLVLLTIGVAALLIGAFIVLMCELGAEGDFCRWGPALLLFGALLTFGIYCAGNPDEDFTLESPDGNRTEVKCSQILFLVAVAGVAQLLDD